MKVKYESGLFLLENQYIEIADLRSPFEAPVTSDTPLFDFTRSEPGFEDVNVYYHISSFQNYIQSLGFLNLDSLIKADAHGNYDIENSYFTEAMEINFGDGKIDDAEDADVIIHEYGHALSFMANNNSISTNKNERKALDEGLGDYLAASYSRSIDDFNWEKVFNWDGNNPEHVPPWRGREVNSTKHYPEDLITDYHENGEIWSSVLMEIWEEIGRETTDKLVLESIYSYGSFTSMKDAAKFVVQSDTFLNGGKNFFILYAYFLVRGLMDAVPDTCNFVVDAGEDLTFVRGDQIIAKLGGNPTGPAGATYLWVPDIGLDDKNAVNPKATLNQTMVYSVIVRGSTGCISSGKVRIEFEKPNFVEIHNSAGFAAGLGSLALYFPDRSKPYTVEIYDILGRAVEVYKEVSAHALFVDGSSFHKGVYILRVSNEYEETVEKIVKLR